MNRNFIRRNITSVAIIIFIVVYSFIVLSKTPLIFNKDGSLREFGVGYSTRSVLPAWLVAILISIISYFSVLYYISMPRIDF
tara:strand:+ start:1762 stop:2007 length:246 start_codon:yes stop_codon:yes gene_type:complete